MLPCRSSCAYAGLEELPSNDESWIERNMCCAVISHAAMTAVRMIAPGDFFEDNVFVCVYMMPPHRDKRESESDYQEAIGTVSFFMI